MEAKIGLFGSGLGGRPTDKLPIDVLSRHECRLCDLNTKSLYSPKMLPTGSSEPIVYMLGEAPGFNEDQEGKQFVGDSGQLLRPIIPKEWRNRIRWNNTIRCWPGQGNPNPSEVQTACCRPSVVRDIEATKPKAIFTFGNFALQWLTQQTGIMTWRGRYAPVKVGSHTCWAFFFLHPAFIKRKGRSGLSEEERVFKFDLERAFNRLGELEDPTVHTRADAERGITALYGSGREDCNRVVQFLESAGKERCVGVDYENYPLKPYNGGKILSAAVSTETETLAFAWHHPQAEWTQGQLKQIEEAWVKFLVSPARKAVHMLSHELLWSAYIWGWDIIRQSKWEDTISQAFVLDERTGGSLQLDFLCLQYFGIHLKWLAGLDRKDLRNEPIGEVLIYNGTDAKYHRNLDTAQQIRIRNQSLGQQYEQMLSRVSSCVLTQLRGIPTNPKTTRQLHQEYEAEIKRIANEITSLPEAKKYKQQFNKAYNPASPQQVTQLCTNILKVNVHSDDDNKDHADKDVLKQINLPITNLTVKYKELVKLKSTYVDGVTENIWSDGLIHHNLNTVFVLTSRSSADSINIQNIPKRTDEGRRVRKQFEAPKDSILFTVDYGQIQARNIAMESEDPVYCKMLWENYDVHTEWAEKITRAYPNVIDGKKNFTDKKIMKEFRDLCKSGWTFKLFFGGGTETSSALLKVPKDVLDPLYDEFWDIFKGIHNWQNRLIAHYEEKGYVENLSGIRRRAPVRRNQLINAPIQADEAEVVFDAFNRLSAIGDPVLQPIWEIHDELGFLLPKDKWEDYAETIIDETLRCTFHWINVPLLVECSKGANWLEMEEVGKYYSNEWFGTPTRPDYAL